MSQAAAAPKPPARRRWFGRTSIVLLFVIVGLALLWDSIDWDYTHFTGDMKPIVRWQVPILHHFQAPTYVTEKVPAQPLVIPGVEPTDYPAYRNVARDGVVTGPELMRDWTTPPKLLWRKACGGGFAGFIVVGKLAITIEQRGGNEAVTAYDIDTGDEVWVRSWPAKFRETMGGPGPRATPAFYDGDVFALGATGHLESIKASTGKSNWKVDVLGSDNKNLMWAMSGSPLVYRDEKNQRDLVVVNPGAQTDAVKGRAVVAYDRKDGSVAWQSGDTQAGYSSPMLVTLAGKRQVLVFDGDGLGSYDPSEGTRLWFYEWRNPTQKITVAQPLVVGDDRVVASIGYGVGSVLLKVAEDKGQWTVTKLWGPTKDMGCKFTSPVLYEGHVYGLDEGTLACIDAEKGERKWGDKRESYYGHGQVLRSGNLLVVLAEDGDLALVEATPVGFHELGRFSALDDQKRIKTWNHLAISNGRAYVRNHEEMACYDLTQP